MNLFQKFLDVLMYPFPKREKKVKSKALEAKQDVRVFDEMCLKVFNDKVKALQKEKEIEKAKEEEKEKEKEKAKGKKKKRKRKKGKRKGKRKGKGK